MSHNEFQTSEPIEPQEASPREKKLSVVSIDIKPPVSLDVISLVASSCGYYRGQIEPRAAQEFAVHVAT